MGGHRSTHQSRHRVPSTVATTCDGGTRCPSGDQSLSLSFSLFGVSFLVGRAGEEMSDGKGHEDDSRGIMKCWDGHRWCGSVSSRASSLSIVVITLLSTRIPDAQAAVAVAIIAVALARIKLRAAAQRMPVPFLSVLAFVDSSAPALSCPSRARRKARPLRLGSQCGPRRPHGR
ncbi:unnamed protein product [Musa acuminata subsp. burmannicoides]